MGYQCSTFPCATESQRALRTSARAHSPVPRSALVGAPKNCRNPAVGISLPSIPMPPPVGGSCATKSLMAASSCVAEAEKYTLTPYDSSPGRGGLDPFPPLMTSEPTPGYGEPLANI